MLIFMVLKQEPAPLSGDISFSTMLIFMVLKLKQNSAYFVARFSTMLIFMVLKQKVEKIYNQLCFSTIKHGQAPLSSFRRFRQSHLKFSLGDGLWIDLTYSIADYSPFSNQHGSYGDEQL